MVFRIRVHKVLHLLWGQCFIFSALYPLKSGRIRKHIVRHIMSFWYVYRGLHLPVCGLSLCGPIARCPSCAGVRTYTQTYIETYLGPYSRARDEDWFLTQTSVFEFVSRKHPFSSLRKWFQPVEWSEARLVCSVGAACRT